MHHSACQRPGKHRQETCRSLRDLTKAFHQPLKQSALRILVAIADAYPSGVFPNLGGHKQKTQTRRRQRRMLKFLRRHSLFPLKQQQPAIQVVGQHHQLKMHAVGGPAPGRMRRQSGIVVMLRSTSDPKHLIGTTTSSTNRAIAINIITPITAATVCPSK